MKFVACAKVVKQLNDEKGHENYPADGNLIRSRHACAGGLDKIRRKNQLIAAKALSNLTNTRSRPSTAIKS